MVLVQFLVLVVLVYLLVLQHTYTLTGNYYGYTSASVSRTLTVYEPPDITFTVDDSEIVRLDTTTLRWSVGVV